MKARSIISASLILILPFIIIIGFEALADYFDQIASRTFQFRFMILGQLVKFLPTVAYIFWLSSIMRAKERSTWELNIWCIFATTAILLVCYLGSWFALFPMSSLFISSTALVCILSNLSAGVYMLVKRKNL